VLSFLASMTFPYARLAAATVLLLLPARVAVADPAAALTATEARWLTGLWPVVGFARAAALPLDIVVQPQPAPEAAPLSLGFVDGRCKLVLSMRGNPEAEATLQRIAPELLDGALELMAAHELGHCRRYLDGAWHGLPAGFVVHEPANLRPEIRTAYLDMRSTRREEAYGDLTGLSWTLRQRPQQYAALHRWLLAERLRERQPGSHHDTLTWLQLAADPSALAARGSIFETAAALWENGLAADD
jgi:hypothetical protein